MKKRTVPIKHTGGGTLTLAHPMARVEHGHAGLIIWEVCGVPEEVRAVDVLAQLKRVTLLPLSTRVVLWDDIEGLPQGSIVRLAIYR